MIIKNFNMRKFFVAFFLFALSFQSFGQKIIRDEIDKFEKTRLVETSWVKVLTMTRTIYIQAIASDNVIALRMKLMLGAPPEVFSVEEGESVYLLFSDDSVVKLINPRYTITSTGGGAIGFSGSAAQGLELILGAEDLSKLMGEAKVTALRIKTSKGVVDQEISSDKANELAKCYKLVYDLLNK